MDGFAAETASLHPDNVQTGQMRMIADDGAERYDISNNDCAATDKCMPANPAKLVDRSQTTHPNLFTYNDVTPEGDIVRKHALVTNVAIVRDVRCDHQKAIRTHRGQTTMGRRTTMNCGMLSYDRALAYPDTRGPIILEAKYLGSTAYDGTWENLDIPAKFAASCECRMGMNAATITQCYTFTDIGECTNTHIGPERCTRFDNGCWMDLSCHCAFFPPEICFCSHAISRIHCRIGLAGVPPHVSPSGTSRKTPADAAIWAPAPIFT